MRRVLLTSAVALLAIAIAPAQDNAKAAQPKPLKSFDLSALDKSVDPCTDFYQYACGGWRKNNPIPSDQSTWGRFNELAENNLIILRNILDKASENKPGRNAIDQKIGDYYASCMDTAAIEKKGLTALKPELDKIANLKDKSQLPAYVASAHLNGINSFFEFSSTPDPKDAKMTVAGMDQGGLGLPDRDYYTKDDAKSVELRNAYQKHVQNMFELAGDNAQTAAAKAKTVMQIETELAKASLDNISRRDPNKLYHKLTNEDLQKLSPAFDWNKYFAGLPGPKFTWLVVAVPDFVKGMNGVLTSSSLDDIKTYLTWHALHASADMLPEKFQNENFAFYGKTLTGAKEIRPRWKRCVRYTDGDLGEALGQAFVAQTFGPDGKQRMLDMVQRLEGALNADIKDLPWMTEETKKQALVKLEGITNKIGYPDKWRDYSTLKIVRGDALGNSLRANEFEAKRQLNKINKPTDRTEWGMTPPTVNAYYNPLENNINFPAGILQPPFFDKTASDASNFGGIGAVIGHELTHGFDDEGRQFDANGNLRDWWTPTDAKAFEERASCISDEYDQFVAVDDVHERGKLELGENTADNGGLRIALMALRSKDGANGQKQEGFTPEQQFFLGWAQVWCQNITPEAARLRAQTDPHALGQYRVNGVVSNMPEFQQAYGCKAGQPMVRAKACRVW